ncbi:unnamed protein product, partial [Symbiodinium sp. KB8]
WHGWHCLAERSFGARGCRLHEARVRQRKDAGHVQESHCNSCAGGAELSQAHFRWSLGGSIAPEDLEGSLRLLRTALRWSRAPYFQHLNVGDTQKKLRSDELVEIEMALRVLTPMDIWLYSYVSADFRARLAALDVGAFYCRAGSDVPQVRIPADDDLGGCIASRSAVKCGADVFEGQPEKKIQTDRLSPAIAREMEAAWKREWQSYRRTMQHAVHQSIVCVSWRSLPPNVGSMGPFRLLDEARSAYAQWAAVSDDDLPVLPPPRTIRALATPSNHLGQRLAAEIAVLADSDTAPDYCTSDVVPERADAT